MTRRLLFLFYSAFHSVGFLVTRLVLQEIRPQQPDPPRKEDKEKNNNMS